jgi:RNA polymerase sigma-70 factor (ECF subfamily)
MSRFDSTQWSLVLRAQGDSDEARSALEALCRAYRPPVLAYVRNRGYHGDAAEDLTQSFFARFLEHAYYADADPLRGRFRAFLLTALKRFLIDADEEAHAVKRGGRMHFESLDNNVDETRVLSEEVTPERAFERAWALVVLDAAMRKLRAEAERAGKRELFETLREFLTERPDETDYARAAATLNLRRNTLAVAVHRLRHRLRDLVRAELAQTAAATGDFEAELNELRAALAGVIV